MFHGRSFLVEILVVSVTVIGLGRTDNPKPEDFGFANNADQVGFYLYPNSDNISDYEEIKHMDMQSLKKSRFMKRKKVVFMVHGYRNDFKSRFPTVVLRKFLSGGYPQAINIISVDWGNLAGPDADNSSSAFSKMPTLVKDIPITYVAAQVNVEVVGKRINEFIQFLIEKRRVTGGESIHLIGHSLGAHICGMTGMYFFKDMDERIDRITGLDPAGPGYLTRPENMRLDKSDADFVDIVHTNDGEFGFKGSLGTVDFLMNGGGPFQPGCEPSIALEQACSHWRAVYYFAISVLDSTIMAARKGSLLSSLGTTAPSVVFGYHCPRTAKGEYHVEISFVPEK